MQLYLIRHAQSENNAQWERSGSNQGRNMDPALTALGMQQAELLARFLRSGQAGSATADDPHNRSGFGLTHLYCSLMVRAVATGSVIAQALNIPLVGWPDWHEGGGIYLEDENTGELVGYPGKDRLWFQDHYPELVLPPELGDSGWWNQPFEERPQRWERARRVIDELSLRHIDTNDRVAIITHGGFYNYFMKSLLLLEFSQEIWFVFNNAAITRIDFTDQELRLVYQNRLDFLPDELLSAG
jgi:2,3-bisphosphoglycerate-dependent phosphoglycerate mutase